MNKNVSYNIYSTVYAQHVFLSHLLIHIGVVPHLAVVSSAAKTWMCRCLCGCENVSVKVRV